MRYKINNILKDIEPSKVFELEIFTKIKYEAATLIDNQEKDGAAEYARYLVNVLENVEPRNNKQFEIYNILFFWLYRLKIFAFSSLSLQEQLDIFKHEIVQIFLLKLDLVETVSESLKILSGSDFLEKRTKDYMLALIDSDATLGNFKEGNFNGQVKSWLAEYRQSMAKKGSGMSDFGAFHILNFFNSSKYTKGLKEEEKEVLKSVFELFNWLNEPIIYAQQRSVSSAKSSYITAERFVIPEEDEPKENIEAAETILEPPVKKLDIQEVLNRGSGIKMSNPNAEAQSESLKSSAAPSAQVKVEAKQEVENLDSLSAITKQIEEKKRIAQEEINKKLENLRKRNSPR